MRVECWTMCMISAHAHSSDSHLKWWVIPFSRTRLPLLFFGAFFLFFFIEVQFTPAKELLVKYVVFDLRVSLRQCFEKVTRQLRSYNPGNPAVSRTLSLFSFSLGFLAYLDAFWDRIYWSCSNRNCNSQKVGPVESSLYIGFRASSNFNWCMLRSRAHTQTHATCVRIVYVWFLLHFGCLTLFVTACRVDTKASRMYALLCERL